MPEFIRTVWNYGSSYVDTLVNINYIVSVHKIINEPELLKVYTVNNSEYKVFTKDLIAVLNARNREHIEQLLEEQNK